MCNVPWIPNIFSRSWVFEPVCSSWYHFSDDVRSFPWRLEFRGSLLFQPKYHISNTKASVAYSSAVIIPQRLLVHRSSGQSNVSSFVKEVYSVLQCDVGRGLCVCCHSRGFEPNVGWQNCFGSMYQEEWSVLSRPVRCGPQAPKYRW
jgi:hypothetical protein